jgi:hypothetical protein
MLNVMLDPTAFPIHDSLRCGSGPHPYEFALHYDL